MPNVRMPDGAVVAFPDDMPADQIKSLISSKFPDAATASRSNTSPIEVELPDGTIAEFPAGTPHDTMRNALQRKFSAPATVAPRTTMFEIQSPDGKIYEVDAPDQNAALSAYQSFTAPKVDPATNQPPGVPAFTPPGVSDYDPQSGTVKRGGSSSGVLAGLSSALEGIPIAGPYLQSGSEMTAAHIASLISGQPYDQVHSEMSDMVDSSQAGNPGISLASGIGGSIAGTLPAVLAAPTAFGAGGGGLLARSLWSGASGAALGGADSAVRSDGDLRATGIGALAGAGTGLVAPMAGKAIGAGWQKLRDFRAARAAAQTSGFDRGTLSTIGRAIRDDGLDPASMGQRMSEFGPDAMMMDLGPNLQRQAGALAATPGRGQEIVRSAIASRQAGAGSRIDSALDDALGQPADTLALADDIVARRADAAKPLYQKAYEEGSGGVWSPELERMAGSPMFADAMRRAATTGQDRAILDGFGSFNPRVSVSQDGRISFNQVKAGGSPLYPDLQYWDYVKRNLDDIAGEAKRAGRSEQASIATNLASRLRSELDTAVPSYKAARDAYSGPSAILDAMEEGQGIFRNSYTPGQLRQKLATMSSAERDAFTQGARAQIADIMGTARNDALAARSAFQKGYNRDKLEMLVGEHEADQMLRALETEGTFANTRDVVTRNSETAARSAAMKEIAGERGPQFGIREGYMSGGMLGAARSGGISAFERIRDAIMGAHQQARNAGLAEALSSRDFPRVVQAVARSQGGQPVNRQLVDEIARAIMLGGGTSAARP